MSYVFFWGELKELLAPFVVVTICSTLEEPEHASRVDKIIHTSDSAPFYKPMEITLQQLSIECYYV